MMRQYSGAGGSVECSTSTPRSGVMSLLEFVGRNGVRAYGPVLEIAERLQIRRAEVIQQPLQFITRVAEHGEPYAVHHAREPLAEDLPKLPQVHQRRGRIGVPLVDVDEFAVIGNEPLVAQSIGLLPRGFPP